MSKNKVFDMTGDETQLNDSSRYELVVNVLKERGVELTDIAEITLELQKQYLPDMTLEICLDHVKRVVMKRETQHAILTGVELDIKAEKGELSEPLLTILTSDYGLYGIDEILALSIVNLYGTIGLTNFGYVDKLKLGIMKDLDDAPGMCHTFLDDIVGAIAAAAASSVAHRFPSEPGV